MASPWNKNLFKVQHDIVPLEKEQAELFLTMTTRTSPLQVSSSRYCTSTSIPNYMGTKTKSCRLDQVMSTGAISQANCEGQANTKSRWLRTPRVAL